MQKAASAAPRAPRSGPHLNCLLLFLHSDASDIDVVTAIDSGPVPVGVEWRGITCEITGKKGKKTKARGRERELHCGERRNLRQLC